MGNLVRKRICAEVQKAGMYSILADETKDCSKREQLAIVLRYVDAESGSRTLRLNDSNLSTFDSILATLEVIKDGDDRPKAVEAIGILTQVRCFRFLLQLLIIFWRILSCTKSLSAIDMARAADLAEATIETFEEFRTDAAWEHLFQYSQDVDWLYNISSTLPRPQRQKRLPMRLEDSVLILEGTGSRDVMTSSAHFKISIHFPILDAMLHVGTSATI